MRVPIADILESFSETLFDLASFGLPVRNERCRASAIRRPWSGSTFNPDDFAVESSKKLTSGFQAIDFHLPMAIKASKSRIAQNDSLT